VKKTLAQLNEVQIKITSEVENYKQAIVDDKPFSEVKAIYLKIKELKQQSLELLEQVNLKMDESK